MKRYFVFTLIISFAAVVVFSSDTSNQYPFDKIIEGGFAMYMIMWWLSFIERWIRFSKKAKARAARLETEMMDCTFIFNNEGIDYQDKEKRLQLSWSLFNSAKILKIPYSFLLKNPPG